MRTKPLTDIEKFCINAILFDSDPKYIDMAYMMTRKAETTSEKPDVIHRMALRWLRDDERVKEYIYLRGYEPYIDSNGMKCYCIRVDDEELKI